MRGKERRNETRGDETKREERGECSNGHLLSHPCCFINNDVDAGDNFAAEDSEKVTQGCAVGEDCSLLRKLKVIPGCSYKH